MTRKEIKNKIQELKNQYMEACEDIAIRCEEEGYPANGSNYDLRCSSLWESSYQDEIEMLYEELEELEDEEFSPQTMEDKMHEVGMSWHDFL